MASIDEENYKIFRQVLETNSGTIFQEPRSVEHSILLNQLATFIMIG